MRRQLHCRTSGQGQLADPSKHSNEPSGYIKGQVFGDLRKISDPRIQIREKRNECLGRKTSGFPACTHADRARLFSAAAWYCSREYTLHKPLRLQEVETPRNSRQQAHERGKIVSPTHRQSILLIRYTCYSFLFETESNLQPRCKSKD